MNRPEEGRDALRSSEGRIHRTFQLSGSEIVVRAKVINGRLVVDEPTSLPDGTVLDLVMDDEGDDLTEEERARLDAALSKSVSSAEAGRMRRAGDVLDDLRKGE